MLVDRDNETFVRAQVVYSGQDFRDFDNSNSLRDVQSDFCEWLTCVH